MTREGYANQMTEATPEGIFRLSGNIELAVLAAQYGIRFAVYDPSFVGGTLGVEGHNDYTLRATIGTDMGSGQLLVRLVQRPSHFNLLIPHSPPAPGSPLSSAIGVCLLSPLPSLSFVT